MLFRSTTGFITNTATSYWTTASTFWSYRTPYETTDVGQASDSPDGDLVEKGGAAQRLRDHLLRLGAHNLGVAPELCRYSEGNVSLISDGSQCISWDQLVEIAHRKYHKLAPGMEPGLQEKFVWEVPTGGGQIGRAHV